MAHGTLSRDHDQRIMCALPAGVRNEARLVACRFPNAPWRIAVLGGRPTRRLTLDENGELIAHIAITGFVHPVRDDLPTTLFHPSIVADRLVLPLDHPAKPGSTVCALQLNTDGNWEEITTIVGDPANTAPDAPYRVHHTGEPQNYTSPPEEDVHTRNTTKPTAPAASTPAKPTQRPLLQQ